MSDMCQECEDDGVKLYHDPRIPPLEHEPCLCHDCAKAAFDEAIDEAETLAEQLKEERDAL